jgi:aspartate/methionine/tyrosine aminotransferase
MGHSDNGWFCDVDKVEAAITARTTAIFVNSTVQPDGLDADRQTLKAILDLARRHQLWIIADEIYALFFYGGRRAPSFMDIAEAEDRIIYCEYVLQELGHDGWRMGWLRVHPSLQQTIENLIQYSTSGVAQFMQRGGVAALDQGDSFLASQIERARQARDLVCAILGTASRARINRPQGTFYLFSR